MAGRNYSQRRNCRYFLIEKWNSPPLCACLALATIGQVIGARPSVELLFQSSLANPLSWPGLALARFSHWSRATKFLSAGVGEHDEKRCFSNSGVALASCAHTFHSSRWFDSPLSGAAHCERLYLKSGPTRVAATWP